MLLITWSHAVVWATGQVPIGEIQPLLVVGHFYAPFDGVLYIPFTRGWELDLARELAAADLPVDLKGML